VIGAANEVVVVGDVQLPQRPVKLPGTVVQVELVVVAAA
jgi:hypothetical protein